MTIDQQVAQELLRINAVKLSPSEPFTWASGLKSPIYCDNRVTLSYPEVRSTICDGLANLSDQFGEYDYIAGVATAGIAHGALLANAIGKPFVYVRASAKAHGRKNQIEGYISKGKSALVVEDLISTGMSSLDACEVLDEAGVKVIGVVAIFNYEFEKARNNFSSKGIEFKTLSSYSSLLNTAVKSGFISDDDLKKLEEWSNDPEEWANKHSI